MNSIARVTRDSRERDRDSARAIRDEIDIFERSRRWIADRAIRSA